MCSDRCRDISLLLTLAVKVKDVGDTKTIALALHDCRFPYKGADHHFLLHTYLYCNSFEVQRWFV